MSECLCVLNRKGKRTWNYVSIVCKQLSSFFFFFIFTIKTNIVLILARIHFQLSTATATSTLHEADWKFSIFAALTVSFWLIYPFLPLSCWLVNRKNIGFLFFSLSLHLMKQQQIKCGTANQSGSSKIGINGCIIIPQARLRSINTLHNYCLYCPSDIDLILKHNHHRHGQLKHFLYSRRKLDRHRVVGEVEKMSFCGASSHHLRCCIEVSILI